MTQPPIPTSHLTRLDSLIYTANELSRCIDNIHQQPNYTYHPIAEAMHGVLCALYKSLIDSINRESPDTNLVSKLIIPETLS